MAVSVKLPTSVLISNKPATKTTMSGARLPGYGSSFGSSLSTTSRRPAPVGPTPLPKRIGTLAKGRTPATSLSPRQPPTGVSAIRATKQSNSAGSGSHPKGYDRNLNNAKPIKEIRRNGGGAKEHHNGESPSDSKPDSGSSGKNSENSNDAAKRQAPALSMDFMKHALSSSKTIYSAQEIKAKCETQWKPTGKTSSRRTKKVSSPTKEASNRITVKEPPKSKLIENIKNEGFAPRVKTHELTNQLKVLKTRLAGDNSLAEQEEDDEFDIS